MPRDKHAFFRPRAAAIAALAVISVSLPVMTRTARSADPPEIGEVLRASGSVQYAPVGAGKFDARTGDPLHAGDRLTIGPAGSVVICFYQTGLRYRLTVAKGAKPAMLPIAANGREDLLPHPAGLRCQPLTTIVASVAQRLSPKARSRFGPLKASSGIRDIYSRVPLDNDALADAAAPAVIAYRGSLSGFSQMEPFVLRLTAGGNKTVIWKSDPVSAGDLRATIPGGTLQSGVRYRWELGRPTGQGPEETPLKTGYLWTLTPAQHTEMRGVVADARKTPLADPTDPDPLILEAGVYHTYGLETLAADTYRAALSRGPVNAALRRQLLPLTQREIVVRECGSGE